MHVLLELASVLLVFLPLYAISRAYHQSPSTRLMFAFAAFTFLEFRSLFMLLAHTTFPVSHYVEELVDFGSDLGAMVLFAGAFLYRTRWSRARTHADVA